MKRKIFLASTISAALAACSPIGTKLNGNQHFHDALDSAERLDERVLGTRGLAALYRPQDISADFPIDSLDTPSDSGYERLAASGFRNFSLIVDGAVEAPAAIPMTQLVHMMNVDQITRHDCVEGWSAVAQWQGVRLADVLALARPKQNARYAIFHCFDRDANDSQYYESLSLQQAAHPQTILALRQNGRPIAADRGAPVRLKVPTQLGYKSAKWVKRIEVAASLQPIGGGKGGYWEDQGYEWYAGI
ncbi:MAG TPA: molybdopterin-dependent oxidoreductase [Candidatus Baltobacteraceae bacterium]|nr:molybdopterin-dependent oxidoreductase [Candidatus Baltobacteraceae bacterium]